jgi:hypothetical protein
MILNKGEGISYQPDERDSVNAPEWDRFQFPQNAYWRASQSQSSLGFKATTIAIGDTNYGTLDISFTEVRNGQGTKSNTRSNHS